MSQTWSLPTGTTGLSQAVKTDIPNALLALRSLHSGNDAPTSTGAYMLWLDVDGAMVKQRDAADATWVDLYPPLVPLHWREKTVQYGTVTTSTIRKCLIPRQAVYIYGVTIWTTTTTVASDGSNNWEMALRNASSGNNLFSSNPKAWTGGGVAGVHVTGQEFTADTAYILTANQNNAMTANQLLTFNLVKNGSPTSINDTAIALYYYFTA